MKFEKSKIFERREEEKELEKEAREWIKEILFHLQKEREEVPDTVALEINQALLNNLEFFGFPTNGETKKEGEVKVIDFSEIERKIRKIKNEIIESCRDFLEKGKVTEDLIKILNLFSEKECSLEKEVELKNQVETAQKELSRIEKKGAPQSQKEILQKEIKDAKESLNEIKEKKKKIIEFLIKRSNEK